MVAGVPMSVRAGSLRFVRNRSRPVDLPLRSANVLNHKHISLGFQLLEPFTRQGSQVRTLCRPPERSERAGVPAVVSANMFATFWIVPALCQQCGPVALRARKTDCLLDGRRAFSLNVRRCNSRHARTRPWPSAPARDNGASVVWSIAVCSKVIRHDPGVHLPILP